jgi:hypothetical protein
VSSYYKKAISHSKRQFLLKFFTDSNCFLKELENNQDSYAKVRAYAKKLYQIMDETSDKKYRFGACFYMKFKENFLRLAKSLWQKYGEGSDCCDWRDDSDTPAIEDEVLDDIISKMKKINANEEYKYQ